MQTARPQSNRKKIIIAVIVLAVIVGGVTGYLLLSRNTSGNQGSNDFYLAVVVGDPLKPFGSWSNLTSNNNLLLNGTSVRLVVWARASGSFSDFVKVKLATPPVGITSKFVIDTLHPLPGAQGSPTGLNLTAAANISSHQALTNFTITGTSVGGSVSHNVTFSLRLRSTTLSISPPVVQTDGASSSIFTVRLMVTDVYDMTGFQVYLNFNSTIIGVLNNTNGRPTFASVFYPSGTIINGTPCDNLTPPCNGFIILNFSNSSSVPGQGQVVLAPILLSHPCDQSCITSPAPQTYNLANITFVSKAGALGVAPIVPTQVILTDLVGGAVETLIPHVIEGSVANLRTTSTALSCLPNTVTPGSQSTCIVAVTDTSPGTMIPPTGLVSFTSSQLGTFDTTSCTLSAGSCQVTFTPESTGQIIITATYEGDSAHSSSSRQDTITASS